MQDKNHNKQQDTARTNASGVNKVRYKGQGQSLKYLTDKICRQAFNEHGAALYHIIKNWENIAGEKIAQIARPLKINNMHDNRYTYLELGVNNPGHSMTINAKSQIIIERIAQYIGYKLIKSIRIKVNFANYSSGNTNRYIDSIFAANTNKNKIPIAASTHDSINDKIETLEDPQLQQILKSWAESSYSATE